MITGWGGGKNIFDEVYAPDALWHLPDRDIHGVERFKRYLTPYINALPDLNATIGDEIAEGEKVKVKRLIISRFTLRGTHQGQTEEFGPPTGRQIELKGMTISRIEGGKIVEEWQALSAKRGDRSAHPIGYDDTDLVFVRATILKARLPTRPEVLMVRAFAGL